jgi:DNA polymerase III alpha subunit (gram-positive type)
MQKRISQKPNGVMGKMTEIYFSTDVETDGPIPGEYSMLSFASVAMDERGKVLGYYTKNLVLLSDAKQHPDTMEFWKQNTIAYEDMRVKQVDPLVAMTEYVTWVKSFNGSPVFVAYPAGFDFLFMYWYMMKFALESPFSFSALDIKSYAMAKLGLPYRKSVKKNFPKHWFSDDVMHTHNALDDAREQGIMFINMLKDKS